MPENVEDGYTVQGVGEPFRSFPEVVDDVPIETDREVLDRIDKNMSLLLETVREALAMLEKFQNNPIMATMGKLLGKGQ